jgi:CMP-2-keto-3-deoxyoctulosonic acid synthetase
MNTSVFMLSQTGAAQFYRLGNDPLEATEKIECLRYLENGVAVKNGCYRLYGH